MMKILVVDDEQDLCEILRFNLSNEGYDVCVAGSAEEALKLLSDIHASGEKVSLILLDVMMDRMSGIEMARLLRNQGDNTPIIFLTAMDGLNDQLAGFEAGADDYITKPFAFDSVTARVKAVLKRSQSLPNSNPTVLHYGKISIDTEHNKVFIEGLPVNLTHREYHILCLLAHNSGTYFQREDILRSVWPNDTYVGDRSVDVHITRLRKKLGVAGSQIINKTGFGYCFTIPNETQSS